MLSTIDKTLKYKIISQLGFTEKEIAYYCYRSYFETPLQLPAKASK